MNLFICMCVKQFFQIAILDCLIFEIKMNKIKKLFINFSQMFLINILCNVCNNRRKKKFIMKRFQTMEMSPRSLNIINNKNFNKRGENLFISNHK